MKFTKTHAKALREFISKADRAGCLPVGEWTSGSGQHTKNKALPPFVKRFERKEYAPTERPHRETPERAAYDFFQSSENNRRKYVLVIDYNKFYEFAFESMHGRELSI